MKQRQYSEKQSIVLDVIKLFSEEVLKRDKYGEYREFVKVIEAIKEKYGIKPPYLTLRQYIKHSSLGAYHTFKFKLCGREVCIDSINDMLSDEYCDLYIHTKDYYVIEDKQVDNGGNCENYHCDHYLVLELKED